MSCVILWRFSGLWCDICCSGLVCGIHICLYGMTGSVQNVNIDSYIMLLLALTVFVCFSKCKKFGMVCQKINVLKNNKYVVLYRKSLFLKTKIYCELLRMFEMRIKKDIKKTGLSPCLFLLCFRFLHTSCRF